MKHLPEYVGNIPSGEGIAVCGEKVTGQELTKELDDSSCPYCKWEWFKRNVNKMQNVPIDGHPLVHMEIQYYDGFCIAPCEVLDAENYHVMSSKNKIEVTCEDCKKLIEATETGD